MSTVFLSHRLFYNNLSKKGGIDYIYENVIKFDKHTYLLENSLRVSDGITKVFYLKNILFETKINRFISYRLKELFLNIYFLKKINKLNKIDYILVNNSYLFAIALIYKKIFFKKIKIYFLITDFTYSYYIGLIGFIIKQFYKLSFKYSNKLLVVSKRTFEKIQSSEKTKTIDKLVYFPNWPNININEKSISKIENSIVTITGDISDQHYDWQKLIKFVVALYKLNRKLKIYVVCYIDKNNSNFKSFKKTLKKKGIYENFIFTNYLDIKEYYKLLKKIKLGVAFYNEKSKYTKFADSLKIRQFASFSVPIISDLVTFTSEEMNLKKAGMASNNIDKLAKFSNKLLSDEKMYAETSENAHNWSKDKKNNIEIIQDLFCISK